MKKFILYKDLIKEARKLGIPTKGLTYSQILKHVKQEKNK
jgi:hypothetical protein